MADNHRPSHVLLVAALRSEFNDLTLDAMTIQLSEHRYDRGSLGVLVQAVHDAHDIADDAGDGTARHIATS